MWKKTQGKIKSESKDQSQRFRGALDGSMSPPEHLIKQEDRWESHRARVIDATRRMAADAGLSLPEPSAAESYRTVTRETNKHGGAHVTTRGTDENKHSSPQGLALSADVNIRRGTFGTPPGADKNGHDGAHGAALPDDVNKHGGAHGSALSADAYECSGGRGATAIVTVKTPKFSGKADWEAFHAQFELLARAGGWSEDRKALELAMCLTDDALSCLLLLSPEHRHDYNALVGALKRRFGQFEQSGLLRSELNNRRRLPGEQLRVLANDIENLTRRAYAHMPPSVQGELARDQFVQALAPVELRRQTQLAHPHTLQDALEMALEREIVCGTPKLEESHHNIVPVRSADVGEGLSERPAWVSEITELIRSVTLQAEQRPRTRPRVCWGCGQTGHLVRQCPNVAGNQGNGLGSA